MLNCSECNGACCRWVCFEVPPQFLRNAAEWARERGGRLIGTEVWLPQICPRLVGTEVWLPQICPRLAQQNNACTIYEKRPTACQLFKVGGRECRIARRLEGFEDG